MPKPISDRFKRHLNQSAVVVDEVVPDPQIKTIVHPDLSSGRHRTRISYVRETDYGQVPSSSGGRLLFSKEAGNTGFERSLPVAKPTTLLNPCANTTCKSPLPLGIIPRRVDVVLQRNPPGTPDHTTPLDVDLCPACDEMCEASERAHDPPDSDLVLSELDGMK